MSGISMVFSVLSFLVLKGVHVITAYYYYIIGISFVGLTVCFFYRKKINIISPVLFFVILIGCSVAARKYSSSLYERKQKNVLISDATIIIAEQMMLRNYEWLSDAINNDNILYLLTPFQIDLDKYILSIYDQSKVPIEEDSLRYHYISGYSMLDDEVIKGTYNVVAVLRSCLKDNFTSSNDVKILPDHVHDVVKARVCHVKYDWEGEKKALLFADSLGNPAASYYLALYYHSGYGFYPNESQDIARRYWKKAAESGVRMAKLYIASEILRDSLSSQFDRGLAIDYLTEASSPITIPMGTVWNTVYDSNYFLNYYYHSIGMNKKAYSCTQQAIKYNSDQRLLALHLENCLICGRYDEALSLILKGEQRNDVMSFLIHAKMLAYGLGVEKNLKLAKDIVKYVINVLDQPIAYHYLSAIYKAEGKDSVMVEYVDTLGSINYRRHLQ